MKKFDLLIIGTLPPPIGGVTMHVQRLNNKLQSKDFTFRLIEPKFSNVFFILYGFIRSNVVHIHVSHSFVRMCLILVAAIFRKKSIFTYHAELGINSIVGRSLDTISFKYCTYPIVLNKKSLKLALPLNRNTRLISPFIFPDEILENPKPIEEIMESKVNEYKNVFCTCAYDVFLTKDGCEVYSISELVSIFASLDQYLLIISDPSSNYYEFIRSKGLCIPKNVLFITGAHEFIPVLRVSDTLIRATLSDGDSLSVKEAMYLGKNVIASDCVDRHEGVVLYKNRNLADLKNKIIESIDCNSEIDFSSSQEGFNDLYKLYLSAAN